MTKDMDLTDSEMAIIRGLLIKALDQIGESVDHLAVDSDEWRRAGRQLGLLNDLLAKFTPPVEVSEPERAAESGPDGVIAGDVRHLIDYIQLPKRD